MKRRSFLAGLGLAPLAAALGVPKNGDHLTITLDEFAEKTLNPAMDRMYLDAKHLPNRGGNPLLTREEFEREAYASLQKHLGKIA